MNVKIIKSLLGMGRKKYNVSILDQRNGIKVMIPLDDLLKKVQQQGPRITVSLEYFDFMVEETD